MLLTPPRPPLDRPRIGLGGATQERKISHREIVVLSLNAGRGFFANALRTFFRCRRKRVPQAHCHTPRRNEGITNSSAINRFTILEDGEKVIHS